jgi:arabinofuranosyltransferase
LNAAEGNGLVFNPGERVEGYSNLLYVAVLTLVALAGSASALYPAALIVNTFALVGLILFLGVWLRRHAGPTAAFVGTIGLSLFPPLWAAVASGLETPVVVLLQSMIVIGALTLSLRTGELSEKHWRHLVIVASVLSILIRPDGFIIPVLAALIILASGGRRTALRLLAIITAAMTVLTVWRLAYYGLPLPMTYYAKVTGTLGQRLTAGLGQLRREAVSTGMLPHLLAIVFVIPVLCIDFIRYLTRRRPPGPYAILGFFGCAWLAYWIYIGGDVFAERFLLIIAVMSWLAVGLSLHATRRVLSLAALPLALQLSPLLNDGRFDYGPKEYDLWVELGSFLGERYPGATLAIDAAGKVPFYSRLATIDMLGLNDAHIGMQKSDFGAVGHSKTDPDYVFARHPDVIAAWVTPQMDMGWGIVRSRYLANGYCLRYLVRSDRAKPDTAIVDLRQTKDKPDDLYRAGYQYGVAELSGTSSCAVPPLPEDGILNFSSSGNTSFYKFRGWSDAEPWGTWSIGSKAELLLPLPSNPAASTPVDVDLQITADGFSRSADRPQQVELAVNGVSVAQWSFAPGDLDKTRTGRIPASVAARQSPASLVFRIEHPASPADAGLSGDTRQLGLGLRLLQVKPAS